MVNGKKKLFLERKIKEIGDKYKMIVGDEVMDLLKKLKLDGNADISFKITLRVNRSTQQRRKEPVPKKEILIQNGVPKKAFCPVCNTEILWILVPESNKYVGRCSKCGISFIDTDGTTIGKD